jgi:hypothetical protein
MNENTNTNRHSVRRIVLPSGRCIEVVRFYDADEAAPRGLHICPDCESELVQPIDWSETSDDRWELTLECPNCFSSRAGIFDEAQVHQLEDQLDDGLAEMLKDLQRLTRANMADQIDHFVAALQADLILPEDF